MVCKRRSFAKPPHNGALMTYTLTTTMTDNNDNNRTLFTILLHAWNNPGYLKPCVESIRKNSTYSHRIIIHVNNVTFSRLFTRNVSPYGEEPGILFPSLRQARNRTDTLPSETPLPAAGQGLRPRMEGAA